TDAPYRPLSRVADGRFLVVSRTLQGRQRCRIAAIAEDDRRVTQQPAPLRSHQGRAAEPPVKRFVRQGEQFDEVNYLQVGPRLKRRLSCRRRLAIPRANVLADVAA